MEFGKVGLKLESCWEEIWDHLEFLCPGLKQRQEILVKISGIVQIWVSPTVPSQIQMEPGPDTPALMESPDTKGCLGIRSQKSDLIQLGILGGLNHHKDRSLSLRVRLVWDGWGRNPKKPKTVALEKFPRLP